MLPILPIGMEFACEITFPVGEAMSDGFLMTAGQVAGIIFTVMSSQLLDEMENQKKAAWISMGTQIAYVVVGTVAIFFVKEDLKRLRNDRAASMIRGSVAKDN